MTDSKSRNMSRTYRFGVSDTKFGAPGPAWTLSRPKTTSSQDDVELFKDILRAADARIKISGLENCAFSYDLPDDGLAKIWSG